MIRVYSTLMLRAINSQVPTQPCGSAAADAESDDGRALCRRRHHGATGRREEGPRETRVGPDGAHVRLRWW